MSDELDYNDDAVQNLKAYLSAAAETPEAFESSEFDVAYGISVSFDWGAEQDARTLNVTVHFTEEPHYLKRVGADLLADAGDVGDTLAADLEGWLNTHFTDAAGEVLFEKYDDETTGSLVSYSGWVGNPHVTVEP